MRVDGVRIERRVSRMGRKMCRIERIHKIAKVHGEKASLKVGVESTYSSLGAETRLKLEGHK